MSETIFSAIIELGKVAYSYKNRKCNQVELDVSISTVRTQPAYDVEAIDPANLKIEEAGKSGIKNWETLKLIKEEKVISISGGIWDHMHNDYMMCGQCLDEIISLMPDNEIVKVVHPIWKEYHLNNMKAGTRQQTEALDLFFTENGRSYNYDEAVEYLKLIGKYIDRKYQYGSSWLLKPVPDEVIDQLIKVCTPTPTKV
jgi:hypothetical protein